MSYTITHDGGPLDKCTTTWNIKPPDNFTVSVHYRPHFYQFNYGSKKAGSYIYLLKDVGRA